MQLQLYRLPNHTLEIVQDSFVTVGMLILPSNNTLKTIAEQVLTLGLKDSATASP